ncbi:hypothetical protein [Sinobacterium caligoides]|uniref:hypothetical protein n=1 Tax=Sinobacterium caligoides TaxID=933926 RepID=UPI0011CE63BF|nr:hypothetical protein [Sinobacterium caligoides]
MNCLECGSKAKNKTKKIKKPGGFFSPSSIVEFLALIIGMTALYYGPVSEHKAILLVVALVVALIGHELRHAKVPVLWCKSCKKEFPLNI